MPDLTWPWWVRSGGATISCGRSTTNATPGQGISDLFGLPEAPKSVDKKGILMAGRVDPRRQGSYGIDAPYWAASFVAFTVANFINAMFAGGFLPYLPAFFLFACAISFFYTTLRGKFVVWAKLLDDLELQGEERILDMGCGRGAVLLLAAQQLTTGQAVGVDLWKTRDQSGNAAETTRRNAIAEGVIERVEVKTADMTDLPLEDNSVDLVISSLAIHNINGRAGRDKALDEAIRVLRPGGRLLVADIWFTRQYEAHLSNSGMNNIASRGLGWRF